VVRLVPLAWEGFRFAGRRTLVPLGRRRGGPAVKRTPRKTVISYLGLAVALGVIAHCSPATTPTIEPTTVAATATPGPPGGPAPAPPANPLAVFSGTYTISATKTRDDGCNFNPQFGGTISITVGNGSQVTARIIERLTRIYSGTIQANGSFTTSGANNFSSFVTTGTVNGQISGNSITADETLNFSAGCSPPLPKTVIYHDVGSK